MVHFRLQIDLLLNVPFVLLQDVLEKSAVFLQTRARPLPDVSDGFPHVGRGKGGSKLLDCLHQQLHGGRLDPPDLCQTSPPEPVVQGGQVRAVGGPGPVRLVGDHTAAELGGQPLSDKLSCVGAGTVLLVPQLAAGGSAPDDWPQLGLEHVQVVVLVLGLPLREPVQDDAARTPNLAQILLFFGPNPWPKFQRFWPKFSTFLALIITFLAQIITFLAQITTFLVHILDIFYRFWPKLLRFWPKLLRF